MTIPKYIDKLISRKPDRLHCERFPQFCVPVIRAFRFLCDEHKFKIEEIKFQRHELWISFTKNIAIPVRAPKYPDTMLKVSVETENFSAVYGNVSVWRNRTYLDCLRSIDIDSLARKYSHEIDSASTESNLPLEQRLNQVAVAAKLIEENWSDVLNRVTRNISRKRLQSID